MLNRHKALSRLETARYKPRKGREAYWLLGKRLKHVSGGAPSSTYSAIIIASIVFTLCAAHSHADDIHQSPYANDYPALPKRDNRTKTLVPARNADGDIVLAPREEGDQNESNSAQDPVTSTTHTTQEPRANRAPAPDFRLRQRGGPGIRLSMLEGNISLLYFWSPSCQKCTKEIRQLEKLSETHNEQGLLALIVNTLTTPRGDLHPSAKNFRTTLPLLYPASQVNLAPYQVDVIPTILVLDEHKRVAFRRQGYGITGAPDFKLVIEQELAALNEQTNARTDTQ